MKRLLALALCTAAAPAFADDSVIEQVSVRQSGETWQFSVTLSHPDTGWEHYADGWRVLDMDGNDLGMRVLAHPHVNEQPFTRSLGGVSVPQGAKQVQVQARCLVDGWAAEVVTVDLR